MNKQGWLVLSLGMLGNCAVLAEYLIYQQTPQGIAPIADSAQYAAIYKVLQTYQWPMLIATAPNLSRTEVSELTEAGVPAEELFLRKKLKELNSAYNLIFIPTTLYEAFLLNVYFGNRIALPEFYTLRTPLGVRQVLENPQSTLKDLYQGYINVNNKEVYRQSHQAVNNELVSTVVQLSAKENISLEAIIGQRSEFLLSQWLKDFFVNIQNHDDFDRYARLKIETPDRQAQALTLMSRTIQLERQMHSKNYALLFRSGTAIARYFIGQKEAKEPLEATFLKLDLGTEYVPTFQELEKAYKEKKESLHDMPWTKAYLPALASVSYGNSLCAGFIRDQTACSFFYFLTDPQRVGYALMINKRDYFGYSKKLIFYSPLSTLPGFFGQEEFFHSRTYSYISPDLLQPGQAVRLFDIYGFKGALSPDDTAHIFVRPGDPLDAAYQLSNFIGTNAYMIKAPDAQGGYNFTQEVAQEFFQAQEQLTKSLGAMVTIRKFLRDPHRAVRVIEKEKVKAAFTNNLKVFTQSLNQLEQRLSSQ